MNLNSLEKKLNKINSELKKDNSVKTIAENIKNNENSDCIIKDKAKQEYYSQLPKYEKKYQQENDKYKELISQYSKAYLELSEFYVGPELPREHYLQSKKDIQELYLLFAFYSLAEPYIEAYDTKFNN